ncbi:hypothetical protein [Hymenobacter sp. UYP22]|uniref:hypothetical protein n=1 Tax=Hymenobacter sp. UYP22 TaxID=3156348 RepID=UPI0033986F81
MFRFGDAKIDSRTFGAIPGFEKESSFRVSKLIFRQKFFAFPKAGGREGAKGSAKRPGYDRELWFDLAKYPQPVTFAPRFHPALPDR